MKNNTKDAESSIPQDPGQDTGQMDEDSDNLNEDLSNIYKGINKKYKSSYPRFKIKDIGKEVDLYGWNDIRKEGEDKSMLKKEGPTTQKRVPIVNTTKRNNVQNSGLSGKGLSDRVSMILDDELHKKAGKYAIYI